MCDTDVAAPRPAGAAGEDSVGGSAGAAGLSTAGDSARAGRPGACLSGERVADTVDVAGVAGVAGVRAGRSGAAASGDREVVSRADTGSSCPQLGFMQYELSPCSSCPH
ncbi:hypothetical protein ACGFIG_14805 [Micromonospora sp. NPDC049048]|uniref:hypothetical protein n=1 Tax=Micromonospora sp. NPDC049048 TaxID=3364263 RepID=UPI00371F4618